jgi:urea carboxylase-associated protein 2
LRISTKANTPNVSALFYRADQVLDRYNMPDTLKGQHISKLSVGSCLHSDMGHLLASLVDSNLDWHDPLCGLINKASTIEKFGKKTFADHHNHFHHNGRDNMLIELGKHGLGKKDIVPNVNFFSKVYAGEDGILHYVKDHANAPSYVTLRMEMDLLVILSNTPHPMAKSGEYPGGIVQLEVTSSKPVEVDTDVCLNSRPENMRAWENTKATLSFGSVS